jgi:modulator of FtsH protease HflC
VAQRALRSSDYRHRRIAFISLPAARESRSGRCHQSVRQSDPGHHDTGTGFELPAPIDDTLAVDLRLRTTSSGLHDVGTRDGLRILVQAYIAWQVPSDAAHVRQFLRAVRNQPEIAAEQLRSFTGSALEITASSFDLANLVNTRADQIKLDQFENALRERIDAQALRVYGISIRQVGIERLTLAPDTLTATIERMRAERETVAAERTAQGRRIADQIRSEADRDSRVLQAQAKVEAADIEAKSRIAAGGIYRQAYETDPHLYTMMRSLESLDAVVGSNTQLILRTDAAPRSAALLRPREPTPAQTPQYHPAPAAACTSVEPNQSFSASTDGWSTWPTFPKHPCCLLPARPALLRRHV